MQFVKKGYKKKKIFIFVIEVDWLCTKSKIARSMPIRIRKKYCFPNLRVKYEIILSPVVYGI